ncbi:MAG: hypothetical protein OHK0022_14900 [Roseiflexaceae bacterium]
MTNATLTSVELLAHMQADGHALRLPRGGEPVWADRELHEAGYAHDPALYALLALAPEVKPWQRARVLLQILCASRAGLADEARTVLERVTNALLFGLPPEQVLTVLLTLRRLCANHKHTTRAVLRFVLDHPQAGVLAQTRRPSMRDCFEHALGKSTARTCARILKGEVAPPNPTFLQRHLLRYSADPEAASVVVLMLYGAGATQVEQTAALVPAVALERRSERPETVTATNRGDIAATLVHLYRGGSSPELQQALDRYVEAAAAELPRFDGTVALVLDTSASVRSYGERQYAALAQSVALRLLLERCCTRLEVLPVGSDGPLPQPNGATDLALPLLDALEQAPDLVAIVSDGYENSYPGDLARVVATLPQCGVATPVVFCHSAFTNSDDLALRRPAPALPERLFWHQEDFEGLLVWLFGHAAPAQSEPWMRTLLLRRLEQIERGFAAAS